LDKQNIIYKVDSRTAEMAPFVKIPAPPVANNKNPYGLLGLYFDCSAKILYASSIYGSDEHDERGVIYAIDPKTGKVMDSYKGIDAMGLCVGGITGQKKLYIGSSRTTNVYSIELLKNGKFTGSLNQEFSLDMLGPRGDDKARKIRFDINGTMLVSGIEFNYNLAAVTEKQETLYRFRYNNEEKKWVYEGAN
jgi:outer membrane protein assembly factor BamB